MLLNHRIISSCLIILLIYIPDNSLSLTQGGLISRWAERIGQELWNLGTLITKRRDIENSYATVNLETKDPKQIISEIVGNVSYMMHKKMVAVKCIIQSAEEAAEKLQLNDSLHDYYYRRSNPPQFDGLDPDLKMYLPMDLDEDTHFFNLAVNTTYSSVHVPTNVYHKHEEAETAIRWSGILDDIFQQNYKADPALTWQYFGSSSGILRHYPAMNWNIEDKGLFDCRIRTWFIEAATCTKDVVILLDNSGSMTGWSKHISFLIVKTIMNTLSNNDYVNVMNYSQTVNFLIPCFKDKLVQATQENIAVFEDALPQLDPQDKSFVDQALTQAFKLLHKYRDIRKCKENTRLCNQAIMLISDGIPSNLSDVITAHNRLNNGSNIPIRIFTYLVGKEPSHLSESVWIACTNRGYHSHVDSLEQVTASVYKYVLVLARPLVLQAKTNPLSWTHVYLDDTFVAVNDSSRRFEKYRLLTSVAGPAFNTTADKGNDTKTAVLLGVAGTDVPIIDIAKLMYPYKTGVNSHSFIVSNNGYVIKHPGLSPMFDGKLKDNYNSIDLTEVEQLDDDSGPREIGPELLDLRTSLVQGIDGVQHDIKIKYHYDDKRRISREVNDYYFTPIYDTPFSIGFAIPDLYGNYSIDVGDEIELHKFSETNISTFFNGTNWKIHPQWVYCKYHYLERHEYDTPELELLEFINRMNTDSFEWSQQYEEEDDNNQNTKCGAKNLKDNDYYCDRNLVQRLVFDAKRTKAAFEDPWTSRNNEEDNLRILYNASLRFVATLSGLTRWEYIGDATPSGLSFGEQHPRTIDETWYKSAVIQHRYNPSSFVYSVPFERNLDQDFLVTGSFAIFPRKGDIETPAGVVGFQFSHEHLQEQFFKYTTSSPMCPDCKVCGEYLECYVIDSSGYIIISQDEENIGKFFGDIEGVTMEAMMRIKVFEKVTIRNYQAVCYYNSWIKGDGNALISPFYFVKWAFRWLVSQLTWFFIEMNINQFWNFKWTLVNANEDITDSFTPKPPAKKCRKNCNKEEEEWHETNKMPVYEEKRTACELENDLYVLNQEPFFNKSFYREEFLLDGCKRPFYMKMIPYTNLLLVAVDTTEEETCYFLHTTAIRDIVYENETTFPCQKLYLNDLIRKPLQGCFNEHYLEQQIRDCGKGGRIQIQLNLVVLSILIITVQRRL